MSVACDVAIVGAGPAGAATARWLARAGCRVILLERSHFETPRAGESLAPAVRPLLCELAVWDAFQALAPLASYGTRSVWGDAQPSEHSHLVTPYGSGFHVERRAFDHMLAQAAVDAGASQWVDAQVIGCTRAGSSHELRVVRDGRTVTLTAAALVDAAGRSSPLPRWLGARRVLFDRMLGIGATLVSPHAAESGFTLVEATQNGWWYSAPCTHETLIAMFMTDGDLDAARGARTRAGFIAALAEAPLTSMRILPVQHIGAPRVYSSISQRVVRAELQARWLSVGDSALSVDPISGSGVVRALETARQAAQTVLAAMSGDSQAIAEYERARHVDCSSYLQERAAYYNLEQRFSGAEFWCRRSFRGQRTSGMLDRLHGH